MPFEVPELLSHYLLPLLIAVPLAIVVFIISFRKGDDRPNDRTELPRDFAGPAAPPAAAGAPTVRGAVPLPPGTTPGSAPTVPVLSPYPPSGSAPSGFAPTQPAALSFELPPMAPRPPAPGADAPALLLVDDSAVVRAKLGKLLECAGYRVTVAKDGVEALEQLGKQRFAVLITDLEMPNMDGFELIAAVQGSLETEDLPIIAITGHDELQARVHAVQGLFGLFKKPWNDRELLKRVETLATLRQSKA